MSLCPVLPSKKKPTCYNRSYIPQTKPTTIQPKTNPGLGLCRKPACFLLPRGELQSVEEHASSRLFKDNVCELLFFHGSLHCPENQKRDLFLRRSGRRSCQQSQQEGSKVTVTASYAELVRALILQPLGPRHFRQQGPHGEPHTAGLMHCEIISTPLCDASLSRFLQVRVSRGHLGPNSLYSPPLGQTVPPSYRV